MRKIVIIEDNELVARMYESKLRAAGNEVLVACDGAEGVRLIFETRPDLVLLDLMLPGKSGIEIIKQIRSDYRYTSLPIMAYSSADEDILAQAVEAGSTTIVSKNEASFKEIFEHFNQLLESSRNWQIYNPYDFKDEQENPPGNYSDGSELDPAIIERQARQKGQTRVLIVEDDPLTSRVISSIIESLENENLEPIVISDGQEAHNLLTEDSNFALVVLDVELPQIKGTDLLKFMREEESLRYIPVVVMTASSDYIKLQIESYASGATFFVSKPFNRTMFESLLRTVLKI